MYVLSYVYVDMTGKEVRDIGYLAWKDPYAWMETMHGKRWATLLYHEKQNFNTLAKQVTKETRHIQQEIEDVYQYLDLPPFIVGNGSLKVSFTYEEKFKWSWVWLTKYTVVDDLDILGNHIWYVIEDDNKSYKNKIVCQDAKGKIVWTRNEVSSDIAVIGDFCYYIMVTNYFSTVEVRMCNALTGKNEKILYKERNKEKDLVLCKASNRTLYFQSSNASESALYRIDRDTVIPLYKQSKFQLPVGNKDGEDCILTKQTTNSEWIARGKPISDWILPNEDIQYVTLNTGHILTISEGAQTIWFCAPRKRPVQLYTIKVGSIIPLYWSKWESTPVESYIIKSPFSIPRVLHMIDNVIMDNRLYYYNEKLIIDRPIRFKPLEVHRFHARSKDGTLVPYVIIKEKGVRPKAQLIYVYGTYGLSSVIDWPYKSWYSLLQRRWAIVYAMVRGGGDNDMQWAEQARRDNRHRAVDDYEAVIRASQHVNHLDASRTVIYGRSAGGVPVGAIVARYPDGDLVGGAYTEVPFVDVLRTTTNPALPLTIAEYKEFGNPIESILNFKELLSVSPVDSLEVKGAPGVFVLTRVGLLDRQVYPYESFKWIQHLRGNDELDTEPKGKYVMFDMTEAHKYDKKKSISTHATDMAILDAWIEKKLKI